jgi:hypothetical protein
VWQDEIPTVCFEPVDIQAERVPVVSNTAVRQISTCAALELFIPRGARSLYGLIALEYLVDDSSNDLVIEVGTGGANVRWEDALVGAFDDAFIGLPSEYVEYIITGMVAAVREGSLFTSGILRCTCAVHALASSNGPIFKQLARALTLLIFSDEHSVDEKRLTQLLL